MKRDLTTDLKSIQEGRTLFDDPDPSVGTKYELYEVAEHAIERALKAEALAQELIEALEIAEGAMYADIMTAHDYPSCEVKVKSVLAKAKEVLEDEA